MVRHSLVSLLPAVAACGLSGIAAAQDAPRLSLPIDCEPRRTCFIQSHVDIDPGPEARDFACGSATYEAHKGVDFRVLSAAAARKGVRVLASADGVVKGVRNNMPDVFARAESRDEVQGKECGNGVVLDHGGGWETQYCHMLQGSVRVNRGQRVMRGEQLGQVGYSGLAQFAHVHLSVRHNGEVVDPFTGKGQDGTCLKDAAAAKGLWDDAVVAAFPYVNGEIIAVGFTSQIPHWVALEQDHEAVAPPSATSPQLLAFARVINARGQDRVRMTMTGPQGFNAEGSAQPLDRNKAVYLGYVGKRLRAPRWPAGEYVAVVELVRDGNVVASARATYQMK